MHKIKLPAQLQAVILDMDGVLVDTEPLHIESFCTLMDEMGIDYEREYVHGFVGLSIADNIKLINKDFFPNAELDIEKCVEKRDQLYLDLIRSHELKPVEGIPELISFCRQENMQVALASSSDQIQIDVILDNLKQNGFDLRPELVTIVSGNDVKQRKPHPDIYELVLQRLSCSAQDALAIEDSPAGVQSAIKAGIHCLALTSPYIPEQELLKANGLLTSITEVIPLIKSAYEITY